MDSMFVCFLIGAAIVEVAIIVTAIHTVVFLQSL
jgi:hypothetical protein